MAFQGYLDDSQKSIFTDALYNVFETFKRPFSLYLDAKVAVVNTTPNFAGMFGDVGNQNATGPSSTPVTPQIYLLSGCILYGQKQPWNYIELGSRGNYQQNKARESEGLCRVKVDLTGYALLRDAEQVVIDGFTFVNDSTPRPHGLVGSPNMYTFELRKVDPS